MSALDGPTPTADGEFYRSVFAGEAERLRDTARAAAATRAFFAERGFVETATPLRVPAPGVDFHMDAIAASGDYLGPDPACAYVPPGFTASAMERSA